MDTSCFVKSRRTQTNEDVETWIEGGLVPTLNAFDVADTRATVLIIETPVLMRQREGKPGGGKGPLMSVNQSLTIATNNDQILFVEAYSIREDAKADNFSATPIEVTNALQAHQPSVQSHHAQTFITQEIEVEAIPLDLRNAGRDPEKLDAINRQGLGVGKESDPAHTVTSAFVHGVAYETDTFVKAGMARSEDDAETWREDNVTPTLNVFDNATETRATVISAQQTIVRRLTPIECERLQGFPDNWTEHRIDHKTGNVIEQADSSRYKQMGNAVAVPCVTWLLQRIMAVDA